MRWILVSGFAKLGSGRVDVSDEILHERGGDVNRNASLVRGHKSRRRRLYNVYVRYYFVQTPHEYLRPARDDLRVGKYRWKPRRFRACKRRPDLTFLTGDCRLLRENSRRRCNHDRLYDREMIRRFLVSRRPRLQFYIRRNYFPTIISTHTHTHQTREKRFVR